VVVASVVVVVTTQADPTHASQQLGTELTHAVPPAGAVQSAAERLVRHDVRPPLVRQHATHPGRPHVERDVHFFTTPRHEAGSVPARTRDRTTPAAHRSHTDRAGAPAQSHCVSMVARVAATPEGSSQDAAAIPPVHAIAAPRTTATRRRSTPPRLTHRSYSSVPRKMTLAAVK
jgi:hypothetical protein